MTYTFYATIKDPANDAIVFVEDMECELEISARIISGEPRFDIDDVLVGGVSLSEGGTFSGAMRSQIKAQAEHELHNGGDLFDRVREREGITYSGPIGSPDFLWRYAS